jgi:hypothetical protein
MGHSIIPGLPAQNFDHPLEGNSARQDIAAVTGRFGAMAAAVPADRQGPIKAGVYGVGDGNGVQGESTSASDSGVWGNNSGGGNGVTGTSDKDGGVGVFGRGKRLAALFEGDVEVTGLLHLSNADCAEDFDMAGDVAVEAGTVMVLGDEGALTPSVREYDKRVAGVVSCAGTYRPGVILDRVVSNRTRQPVALMGKVFCKVDARYGAVEIGDLLTTSATHGHAMRADVPSRAFGAVIGKALRPLHDGQGLIPILVALQ